MLLSLYHRNAAVWLIACSAEESAVPATVVVTQQDQNWRPSSSTDVWYSSPADSAKTSDTGMCCQTVTATASVNPLQCTGVRSKSVQCHSRL